MLYPLSYAGATFTGYRYDSALLAIQEAFRSAASLILSHRSSTSLGAPCAAWLGTMSSSATSPGRLAPEPAEPIAAAHDPVR